jgi:crotonobetainyl-CoA:carnitine CoA-transferase CaiB-like acyl-CoA transferase
VRRSGNEHREFVPVNVYPTSDGHLYLAIGNDVQWARLVSVEDFDGLASPTRLTNEGRRRERDTIHTDIAAITRRFPSAELVKLLSGKGLVAAPIHTVPQVVQFPPIRDTLLETRTASGKTVRLPPPSVEREALTAAKRRLPYAPAYGQNTERVLGDAGFSAEEVAALSEAGIVASALPVAAGKMQ